MDKSGRAIWLNKKLGDAKIPEYGRAATIAKRIECSNAVCQGWLQGSLPKDLKLAMTFSREFNINLHEWVTGEPMPEAERGRWQTSVKIARRFEREMGELSDDQFIMVTDLIFESNASDTKQIEDTLKVVAHIVSNKS